MYETAPNHFGEIERILNNIERGWKGVAPLAFLLCHSCRWVVSKVGPEETTNLGGSQERWIPDPNDHARFCISATSQTVLYMIFFKLKLVLIDAISAFFSFSQFFFQF